MKIGKISNTNFIGGSIYVKALVKNKNHQLKSDYGNRHSSQSSTQRKSTHPAYIKISIDDIKEFDGNSTQTVITTNNDNKYNCICDYNEVARAYTELKNSANDDDVIDLTD